MIVKQSTQASRQFRELGLFGWFFETNYSFDAQSELRTMQEALRSSLSASEIVAKNHACSSTGTICHFADGGIAAIVGYPCWHASHLTKIAREKDQASALALAYTEHGSKFLDMLRGAFSFIIIHPQKHTLLAGIDRLGQFPLYYAKKRDGVIVGSSANSVLAHSAVNRELLEQGIYDYVYFHMVPSPVSIFQDLQKLPAGHYLEFNNGKAKINNYWRPKFEESSHAGFDQMAEEMRQLLRDSVRRSIHNQIAVGAFLSGGLDSSTVTGLLAELSQNTSRAYSIGFSAKGYDEMAYARITAKHFGVDLHEYYVTPEDVVDALPSIATSYDEPFGNSSALPTYFCARFAAEDGIQRLLAGDGGDEIFAGNERYAKQAIFEAYGKIPSFIRSDLLEPLLNSLPCRLPLIGKARSYVHQANIPLPDRLETYNVLHRHEPAEIFSNDFLAQVAVDIPLKLEQAIYNAPAEASTLNRMLYLDWQFTLADNDLRKVSHMCALAGVEVVYPMLDDKLVQFSCRLPGNWKLKDRKLRYFYKEALRNWLPRETINKKKKGFGLPFGVWMQTHKPLQELAYDNLLKLKKRAYFKSEFIDNAIDLHRNEHASYYGELIWILMVLELWMEQQQTSIK
jgi:asparagine synthase (glutamine-hydrolysing)